MLTIVSLQIDFHELNVKLRVRLAIVYVSVVEPILSEFYAICAKKYGELYTAAKSALLAVVEGANPGGSIC